MLEHIIPVAGRPYLPPEHLRPYLKTDGTKDYYIADESIPMYYRMEFEDWHKWYVEQMEEDYQKYVAWRARVDKKNKDNEPWHLRECRMSEYKRPELIGNECYSEEILGLFINNRLDEPEYSDEYIIQFYDCFWGRRNAWLKEVERQKSIPGYLPDDFEEQNFKRFCKKYHVDDDFTIEDMYAVVDEYINYVEDLYKEALTRTEN